MSIESDDLTRSLLCSCIMRPYHVTDCGLIEYGSIIMSVDWNLEEWWNSIYREYRIDEIRNCYKSFNRSYFSRNIETFELSSFELLLPRFKCNIVINFCFLFLFFFINLFLYLLFNLFCLVYFMLRARNNNNMYYKLTNFQTI